MIARIDCARYRLPLRPPCGGASRERGGLVVALRTDDGGCGYGEIAPLAGWHRESLEEAEHGATCAADELRGATIPDLDTLADGLEAALAADTPSTRFGLEMAWLASVARQRHCTPAEVLSPDPAARVAINGLWDGGAQQTRDALRGGDLGGYALIKVKVGRRPVREEREVLRLLLGELDPATRLRLDGNRALRRADAVELLDGTPTERIEYFEEPLRDVGELASLAAETGISIGLDESLREPERVDVTAPWVGAWVIKPSLAGGFRGTLRTAARARDAGIECVVSSCFESGLGLGALAQLAACVGNAAAGLATDRWLAADLIEPRFSSEGGAVATRDWVGEPSPAVLRELGLAEPGP